VRRSSPGFSPTLAAPFTEVLGQCRTSWETIKKGSLLARTVSFHLSTSPSNFSFAALRRILACSTVDKGAERGPGAFIALLFGASAAVVEEDLAIRGLRVLRRSDFCAFGRGVRRSSSFSFPVNETLELLVYSAHSLARTILFRYNCKLPLWQGLAFLLQDNAAPLAFRRVVIVHFSLAGRKRFDVA
jgi:hypothetical protein